MWKTVLLLIVIIVVVPVAGFCFSQAVIGSCLSWSLFECSLLFVLFQNSSDFSAKVLDEKLLEYADYQKRVPRFVLFTKFGK